MSSPEVALDNQLILLRVSATDDQVVFAGHKPVELLKPQGLAHMLDGCLGAHLAQLLLRLLLSCLQRLLIGVHCLLLLHDVLLALLIVDACIGICIEVQIKLHLQERKEETTPFGVNLMRSQVLYRAAQGVKGIKIVLARPVAPPARDMLHIKLSGKCIGIYTEVQI